MVITALDTSQVKTIGIAGIAVVIVLGLLIARLVTKIITRVIVLIVMVALAVVLYQQRDVVAKRADDAAKRCEITFFGVHVTPSDPTIKKQCQQLADRKGG
jgi:hypothetical protein